MYDLVFRSPGAAKKRPAGPIDPAGAYARNRSREEGRYTGDGIECLLGLILIGLPVCLGV